MGQHHGTSKWQEVSQSRITLDPRSIAERIGGWLAYPSHYAKCQIALALCAAGLAFIWLPITLIMLLLQFWFAYREYEMPMRYPKHVGGIDPSLDVTKPHPNGKGETIERHNAEGILYLGNQRSPHRYENLKELWVTNSDARTHMLLMGTTGSGKTVTLLSLCFNALTWGSGFFYSDGKADNSLHAAVWSLCRRVGREDDFLVLNFMTGGADPYSKKKSTEKSSNGMNPWSEGDPDFLSQLSSSLLPKVGGDGAQWQQKAVNMMDALIRTLCYERAIGNLVLSIEVIREYLSLPNLVKLYLKGKRGEIPEFAFLPIKAYLETGLPGFRAELADKPDKWDQTIWDQHGYLTGQYARTLSMLIDTYGYIFKDQYPEVDMMDVLLNRRILVVMIPALEKSAQESANLGKLVIATIRLMMAMNLGHKLEGTYQEIIETKATISPAPYIINMDEIRAYFAEGVALMFAQARGLGFMMIASGQDIAGMAQGEHKEEVESMIANTKIKYTLALEDPDKTLDIFKKIAGQAITVETGAYEGSISHFIATNYRQNLTGSIQRHDRIELQELKALKEMEGIVIFKDQVTRARSFTWFHSAKFSNLPFRINRFLQVARPKREALAAKLKPIDQNDSRFTVIEQMMQAIRFGQAPMYRRTVDPVVQALRETVQQIKTRRPNESPTNKGIAYYIAALNAMQQHSADRAGRYWKDDLADFRGLNDEVLIEEGAEREPFLTASSNANDESRSTSLLNPVYHDPPLEEKTYSSFEDKFFRSSTSSVETSIPINDEMPSSVLPKKRGSIEKNQTVFTENEERENVTIDDNIDAFLRRLQLNQAERLEQVVDSDKEESSIEKALSAAIESQLSVSTIEREEKNSATIGLTEKATQGLIKIDTALGGKDSVKLIKQIEAKIDKQLAWRQSVAPLTVSDLNSLFDQIEMKIKCSAKKAR